MVHDKRGIDTEGHTKQSQCVALLDWNVNVVCAGGKKVQINDIVFVLILDTCRLKLGGDELDESYSQENDPEHPPKVWAVCASTSRFKSSFENPKISTKLVHSRTI